MTTILHPPEDVSFSGNAISAEDRTRIARVLLAAVLRAVENADGEKATRPDRPAGDPGGRGSQETFDPARAHLDEGIYQIPSYRDEGRLAGVKLLESRPEAVPNYEVKDEPSPLEGGLIMSLPGLHYVNIRSPRYVTAGSLGQAYALGLAAFGTTSFAVLQGPWGSPKQRYWAVGTDPAVAVTDLHQAQLPERTSDGTEVVPQDLAGKVRFYAEGHMESAIAGTDGEYLTRGFITTDRSVYWWSAKSAADWFAQLQAEQKRGVTAPPTEEFRRVVFSKIDQLVAQIEGGDDANLQRAAELLSRMDWVAFSLVGWEVKVGYLKVLLAAWTWQEEQRAVVQIFKSLSSDSEVDAVIALLKQAGRYDQLFDDLGGELYDLLTTVGERFPKEHGPLTFDGLIRLLQSMDLIPRTMNEALLGSILAGPEGITVPEAMLDEAYDAVLGFRDFGVGLGESLATIFTDPQKVVEGIEGLAQLLVKVELASYGYLPAVQEVAHMLAGIGEKILAGMRGADRLGCGPRVVSRIKWRLVWEIASFFIGAGEIKAAIEGAGLGEKLAGVLRFLAALGRLGEAADAETEGVRLARLATLITAERAAFSSVEEAAELLSRLPEQDITHLGRLVSRIDIEEGETLAGLATRSPELHAAVEDAMTKAELLKSMADQAGGLTDEIVEAFHALIGEDGLGLGDAQRVAAAIPPGEGARFAATLRRIPLGQLAEGARASFLELLAASPRRMDAFAKLGADTFWSVYRRVTGRGEMLDQYLGVLDEVEGRLAGQGEPGGFRRLLDRLEHDDPAAWLEVENSRRVRTGERAISDWTAVASGSPRAQRGLDMLLRGGHEDLVTEIMDMPDEVTTLHQLELAGELTPQQADGLAAIKRAEIDFGGEMGVHDWTDVLDLPPGFRNDLLDLVAEVEGAVDDGLDLAVKRGLAGGTNVQGTLGHFYAARTLQNRFPGARFRFELPDVGREIDIEMSYQGRRVDVEVKTNLGSEPSVNDSQIEKDLASHIGDRWEDMLYLYAPQQAGRLADVQRAMLRALERLHADGRLPIPLADAEKLLRDRFAANPPWKLVDVFTY
jgi:hypothetical protein